MKGTKSAFAVLCLSIVCASAHAQEYATAFSYNSIGIYAGYGVYITNATYLVYPLSGTYATGAAATGTYVGGIYGQYSSALNEAFAGPGNGFAQTGTGFEQYLTFTNENPTGDIGYFSVYSFMEQVMQTSANGSAIDYGGIAEVGGQNFYGFNTIGQNGLGPMGDYAFNWFVDYSYAAPGYSFVLSYGGFSDYLLPGQSITVGIWASGIVSASSTGSSTPAPAAIAPFAIGLVGALRRRNKKS